MRPLKNEMKHILDEQLKAGIGTPKVRGSDVLFSIGARDCYAANGFRFNKYLVEEKGLSPYVKVGVASEYVRDYLFHLDHAGYVRDTVRTAKFALRKIFGAEAADYTITTPKRPPKNGREETKTSREAERRHPYEAACARCIGIRRREYLALTGKDFIRDAHGLCWVYVANGKGGKEQYQFIPPQFADFVESFFLRVGKDEKVFKPSQLRGLQLHRYRRELAQFMYFYYLWILETEPEAEKIFKKRLLKAFRKAGVDPRSKPDMRRLDKLYHTQGQVRQSMIDLGMPTIYDRLALMMVAVFHLSHWRVSVVVQNYMR